MPTVRKKRRLKRKYRIILFFICVFLALFIVIKTFFGKDESSDNNNNNNINTIDYKTFITDSIESDHESSIDTIFADGMNIDSYKSVLDKKENYLNKEGKYSYIDYNFDTKLHYSEIENIIKMLNIKFYYLFQFPIHINFYYQ